MWETALHTPGFLQLCAAFCNFCNFGLLLSTFCSYPPAKRTGLQHAHTPGARARGVVSYQAPVYTKPYTNGAWLPGGSCHRIVSMGRALQPSANSCPLSIGLSPRPLPSPVYKFVSTVSVLGRRFRLGLGLEVGPWRHSSAPPHLHHAAKSIQERREESGQG